MTPPIDHTPTDIGQPQQMTLVPMSTPVEAAQLSRVEADKVRQLIESSRRPNTVTAYASDLRQFARWVQTAKPDLAAHIVANDDTSRPTIVAAVPVAAVLAYIAAVSETLAVTTVRRHVSTLSAFHQLKGWPNPAADALTRAALKGVRATQQHQPKQAHPLRAGQLRTIIMQLQTQRTPAAVRDRALMLVGWNGALRRSEIANLTWGQVQTVGGGVVLRLTKTKTDKTDAGQTVALPEHNLEWLSPPHALMDWLRVCEQAGLGADWETLPVFCEIPTDNVPRIGRKLSGKAVGQIVQRRATRAGLDAYRVSGHSLRAGLITEAHAQGVSDVAIMRTSRHVSHKVFSSYIRDTDSMRQAASHGLL